MAKRSTRVPAIMYHSVGIPYEGWHWNFLTCPYKVFKDQIKWLDRAGYYTLNFQELYDYVMNDKPIKEKSVFLTFDDGYLDNYMFVYPLLKKYGMKGTIFVNPDFVDKTSGLRKTIDDYQSIEEIKPSSCVGFCNWDELRKIDSEGVLDVQSHAKTHDWYPISDKIIDFRHPEDTFIWMDWNEFPKEKYLLQCIDKQKVKLGSAVFENEKSLSSPRVFINPDFQKSLQTYVRDNGGKSFFQNSNWKDLLVTTSEELRKKMKVVMKEETHEEYLERIEFELKFTKNIIEKELNKKVNFLCWPGGSGTTEGVKIADRLGYLMSTAARDIPIRRKTIKNSADEKINRISRITPIMYHSINEDGSEQIRYSTGWFFILQLLRFKNKYYAGFWVKGMRYFIEKLITLKK